MDPASIVGLVAAVVQLTGTCLKTCGKFLGPSKQTPKDLQEVTKILYSFHAAVINLRTHLDTCEEDQARLNSLSSLHESLEKSMKSIGLIKARLEDTSLVGKLLLGVAFDKKLKECLKSLKTAKTLYKNVIHMDNRNIIVAIQKYVRDIAADIQEIQSGLRSLEDRSQRHHQETREWQAKVEQKERDDEERKILDWLSSLNFESKQNDIFRRRHAQTGSWFLDSPDFQNWVTDRAKTLYCSGIPGAGKTVLASISTDYLLTSVINENSAVIFVFCNHADEGQQRSVNLMASLLEQLVRRKGVTEKLRMLYQHYQVRKGRPELQEVSDLMHSTIEKFTKVFIVIDALDECQETERNDFICEIHKLRATANVLITSRQIESIELAFRDATRLKIHALDSDLRTYTESKTLEDRQLARYVKEDPSLQTEIVEKIVSNAGGMFLLAHLHVESLARQLNKRSLRKALDSLPEGLDQTYDQTMKRISSQGTVHAHHAERVLAWISNVRRPLSVKELQHALAVESGDTEFPEDGVCAEEDLVSYCAGLVTVDRDSRIIRLVHHTTHDYLRRRCDQLFPTIQVDITKSCITYLQLSDFESEEHMPGKGRVEFLDRLRLKYPFLEYAGKHWGHHARGPPEVFVRDLVDLFLQRKLWVQLTYDMIDDSPSFFDFGPLPPLTILAYFGLECIVSDATWLFDDQRRIPTCAIRFQNHNIVFLLVDRDAYWYDDGAHSLQAEYSSQNSQGKENMVRILAKKGLKMDFGVENGGFLFNWARSRWEGAEERKAIPFLLRELGANCDPQYRQNYTDALIRAVIQGDNTVFSWVLSNNNSVNKKNRHGRDALIYAALVRNEVMARLLLGEGADVHTRDNNGMTALCAACEGGNESIVKLLIKHGADISAEDRSGRSAISIATERKNKPILRLLKKQNTGGQWENEMQPVNKLTNEAVLDIFARFLQAQPDLDSSDDRFVVALRRGAKERGYEKIIPAFLDAYGKEIQRESDPSFATQQERGLSESDILARRIERAWEAVGEVVDRHRIEYAPQALARFNAF